MTSRATAAGRSDQADQHDQERTEQVGRAQAHRVPAQEDPHRERGEEQDQGQGNPERERGQPPPARHAGPEQGETETGKAEHEHQSTTGAQQQRYDALLSGLLADHPILRSYATLAPEC